MLSLLSAKAPGTDDASAIKLDLVTLVTHASWPVRITVLILIAASVLVWIVAALKILQVRRLGAAARAFEVRARRAVTSNELYELVATVGGSSAGSRVLSEMFARPHMSGDRLRAAADRAIVTERQRARSLMSALASIASVSPFVGLFGTVYGIMDAFVRIGAAKSASLPVVAPAIGEALITTAIGLAAAIPALVFYNSVDRMISDVTAELEASAAEWVAILAEAPTSRRG
jgi:biopolymer transport protein TolQ